MSDVSVTVANVKVSAAGVVVLSRKAGAAITAGQVVYLDTAADNVMKLSDANSGTAAAKAVTGIALNSTALGQPVAFATEDPDFEPGFTTTEGVVYVLSGTAGGIAPAADLASGMVAIVLGIGKAGGKLNFKPLAGGAVA